MLYTWKKIPLLISLLTVALSSWGSEARIKDVARIDGIEALDLIGYGVVVGLNSTGDNDIQLTQQTMANLLERFHISLPTDEIKSKNVAAVMVTATVPPFHRKGDRVDVLVSSIGDASSLSGGTLLMTPLLDAGGQFYALAQGNVTVAGFSAGSSGAGGETVTRNHTTSGVIPQAGLLKKSDTVEFYRNGQLDLLLNHPDFTTADRMATSINQTLGGIALARSPGCVVVRVPDDVMESGRITSFVATLERLPVETDARAKIVINERTGTIVMGGNVQVQSAVVAHGNLTVTVKETIKQSQPEGLFLNNAPGVRSLETPDIETTAVEESAKMMVVPETTNIQELSDTLNLMGATPRDIISILEALRRVGALQMEIESM
jgi:flagellar P-ring protein precursor FlgI